MAESLLAETTAAGGRVVVLDLVFAEVANAIWKRLHRSLLPLQLVDKLVQELESLPVTIEPFRRWLAPAMTIAKQFDRSIYDALFVAAARDLKVRGVTSDIPLHAAVATAYPEIVLLRDWKVSSHDKI